jgi:hypothetical protein
MRKLVLVALVVSIITFVSCGGGAKPSLKLSKQAGSYDFRMHDTDDNGKEVASITFQAKVVTEGAELSLDKNSYAPKEEIRLTFTAPATFGPKAWVGLIPSDVPHGSEDENDRHDVSYQYLEKKTQGLFVFNAPEKAGKNETLNACINSVYSDRFFRVHLWASRFD